MFDLGYTLTLVMVGTFVLGLLGGFLGSILVLRRQALMGDALAHATLPGVMLAFMLLSTRSLNVLLLGAFLSAWVAYGLMQLIRRQTIIGWDATMALMLSGFFGFGQWLLSIIQRQGRAAQGGLSRFIFGQAATMLQGDVITLMVVSSLVLVILLLALNSIRSVVFDRTHFRSLGYSSKPIEWLLSTATLIFIVLGIRLVGVVLISALLIGPALIARLWTSRFSMMLLLASVVGGFSGAIGSYSSATVLNVPTGPMIVLVLGFVLMLSLAFAPQEGAVTRWRHTHRLRRNIQYYQSLIHVYENPRHSKRDVRSLETFVAQGYVAQSPSGWSLTERGKDQVEAMKRVILDES